MSSIEPPKRRNPREEPTKRKPGPPRLGHVRDLTGLVSGTLVVKHLVKTQPTGEAGKLNMAIWECKCSNCGHMETKQRRYLVSQKARCSACHRKIRGDLTGKRYGRWTVLGPTPSTGWESRWYVRCDCGTESDRRRGDLTTGDSKSCGCLFDEVNPKVMAKARKARWAKHRKGARS